MPITTPASVDIWSSNWKNTNTVNSVESRILSILQENTTNQAISVFIQIVNESALRQVNMLGLSEEQKVLIKKNLFPHLGHLVKILESDEGEAKDDNETHWYLLTPDVNNRTLSEDYIKDLIDPEKTHIWIYLWRITNKGMLIKTINHELNHLFLRYIIWVNHSGSWTGSLDYVFNQNERFPVILECLWFLWWSESGIISWYFSQNQGLKSAEEWSNWDINDSYTVGSILAKRVLEVQLYFWNKVWNNNPDFIRYCELIRYNLYRSIFSKDKFKELVSILELDKMNFSLSSTILIKMLNWAWTNT